MHSDINFSEQKLLHLAGLEHDAEKDKDISGELERISEFVEMTGENEPSDDIREKIDVSVLRDDISNSVYDRNTILEGASLKNEKYICVPKIL